jgi:hypothetical protein
MKRADPEHFDTAPASTRHEHATRISGVWRKAVECIIEAGSLLIEAKEELDHGEFEAMIRDELPFTESTARRLMSIASHPVLANRAHVNVLPPSWGTLYELSKMKQEDLERAIEDGVVNSKMERKDTVALLGRPVSIAASNEVAGDEVHTEARCAFCKEIENTPAGHQWCDATEDQPASLEIVEGLAAQIKKFLGYPETRVLVRTRFGGQRLKQAPLSEKITLRHKIDRLIEARESMHPSISDELSGALRKLATTATDLAARLEALIATVPADDEKLSSDSAQPEAVERVKKKPPSKRPGWR